MRDEVRISTNLTRKIDKFIVGLASNLSESKETIRDFQDEMKANFITSCTELIKEGHSEEEAFDMAVKRFGDVGELKEDLTGVFSVRSKVNKIAFIVTLISIIMFAASFLLFKKLEEYKSINYPLEIENETSIKIQEGKEIDESKVNEAIKNYSKTIKFVVLYKEENNKMVLKNVYPSNFDKEEISKTFKAENYFQSDFQNPSKEQYELRVGFNIINVPIYEAYIMRNVFFILYWIAFGIWATTNAQNKNKFNLGWGILFFLFNIIGYGIFKLDGMYRGNSEALMH